MKHLSYSIVILVFFSISLVYADDVEEEFLSSSLQLHYLHSDNEIETEDDNYLAQVSRRIIPQINLQVRYGHNPSDAYAANLVFDYKKDTLFFINYSLVTSTITRDTPSYAFGIIQKFAPDKTFSFTFQYADSLLTQTEEMDTVTLFFKYRQIMSKKTIGQIRYYISMQEEEAQEVEFRLNQYLFLNTAVHLFYIYNISVSGEYIQAYIGNFLIKLGSPFILKLGYTYQVDSLDIVSRSPKAQITYRINQTLSTYISYRYFESTDETENNNYGAGVNIEF